MKALKGFFLRFVKFINTKTQNYIEDAEGHFSSVFTDDDFDDGYREPVVDKQPTTEFVLGRKKLTPQQAKVITDRISAVLSEELIETPEEADARAIAEMTQFEVEHKKSVDRVVGYFDPKVQAGISDYAAELASRRKAGKWPVHCDSKVEA